MSCYFRSLPGEANRAFLEKAQGDASGSGISAFFAQSYSSILLIADGIARAGTDAIEPVLASCKTHATSTPLGDIIVDARTNHIALPAHIGRARNDGGFDIVHLAESAIQPDPFMARTHLKSSMNEGQQPGFLRLVK